MSGRIRRRRWAALLCGLAATAGVLGGLYAFRLQQVGRELRHALAEGRAALAAGDHTAALHRIGRYLQQHETDVPALYDYAQARERVEEPNGRHVGQAIRVYTRLLQLDPSHTPARRRLLDLYLASRFDTETLLTADQLLLQRPDDAAAYRAKAVASARLRRNEEALGFAARYNELAPADVAGHVMRLQLMLQGGRPKADLQRHAAAVRAARPGDGGFDLLCSVAASMADDAGAAKSWALRAAGHGRVAPELVVPLAQQLNVVGQFDEALAVLRRGADVDARPEAVAPLAARLWEMGRWAELESRLAVLDGDAASKVPELLAFRALALAELGRSREAEPYVRSLAADVLDPAAVAWAKAVPRATSGSVGVSGVVVVVGGGAGGAQPDRAGGVPDRELIAACEAALRRVPAHPYFHFFLGDAYARLGDDDLAMEHWQQAFQRSPAWVTPLNRIAWALISRGRPADAREVARLAVQRGPADGSARAALAWAWSETLASPDDRQALLKFLDEGGSAALPDDHAAVVRAAVLAAAGRRDEAARAVRSLMAASPPPPQSTFSQLTEIDRRWKLGVADECFRRWEKAYGVTPDWAHARAASLLHAGRRDDALRLVLDGASGDRGPARAWQVVGARVLDLANEKPAAADAWAALAESGPDDVSLLWWAYASPALAADRERRGRVLELLRPHVDGIGINWRLARAQFLAHDGAPTQELNEAAELLRGITLSRPKLVGPRLQLAAVLTRCGKADEAVEQLAAVVHLEPATVSAALNLSELLQSQGEFGRAREYLGRLIASPHAGTTDKSVAASLLARQGESAHAIQVLERLLDGGGVGSGHTPMLVLASLYRARGQTDKAESIYRELLEAADGATIREAASFYASRRQMADARNALAKLESAAVAPVTKSLLLGEFEARHGDPAAAARHFEAAVAADPSSASVLRQLVAFHIGRGRGDDALAAIDRAGIAADNDPALSALARHRTVVPGLAAQAGVRPLLLCLLSPANAREAAEAIGVLTDGEGAPRAGAAAAEAVTDRLAQVAARHPRLLPLQNLLAQRYIAERRFDEAVKVGTRTTHLLPTAPEPARLTAEALLAAGRGEEALAAARGWRECALDQPLSADMLIAVIQTGLGRGRDAVAQLAPYMKAALADPDANAAVVMLAARARLAAGRPAEAAALLRPMLRRSRQWRTAWVDLSIDPRTPAPSAAAWLEDLGPHLDTTSAEEVITAARGWYALSRLTGDARQARTFVGLRDRARELVRTDSPGHSVAHLLVLACLFDDGGRGDVAVAEGLYRRVLRARPDAPEAMNNLAMILANRGGGTELAEATALARRAAELAPRVPNFHDTLAAVLLKRCEYDRAVASLEAAVRLDPRSAQWRVNLAHACIAADRLQDARAQLDQVDARHPNGTGLSDAVRRELRVAREALRGRSATAGNS